MTNSEDVKKTVISCGAVVYKRNAVGEIFLLLVKPFKKKEVWGLPKGHVEPGESYDECAHREVFEETGIRITLREKLPVISTVYGSVRKDVHAWLAEPVDPDAEPFPQDGENDQVEYVNVDNMPRLHLYQQELIAAVAEAVKGRS